MKRLLILLICGGVLTGQHPVEIRAPGGSIYVGTGRSPISVSRPVTPEAAADVFAPAFAEAFK